MIYYIADNHFGHKNVIRFDNRPFADTVLMDEVLVHNWNERVTEDDTVYILGDCFWKNEENSVKLIQRLKGHKHLIRGNHDRVHGRLRFYYESIEHYDILPDGRIFIFGHTPTECYQDKVPLSIYHGKGKIGIDCGSGNPHEACRLACLRLEDMKEYYSDYS